MGLNAQKILNRLAAVLVAGCLAGALTGCKTSDTPASSGFAAVEIQGNTPGQISEMAIQVFEEAGYLTAMPGRTRLVFEKEGSSMNNVAYGNWIGDTPVWVRVKVSVVHVSETRYRLECQAFMVRDRASTTEEEIKLSSVRRSTYQKLLEETARRLGAK